ncbi:MAG TPA: type II toxin-antitoxin system VapC family toxin [Terracidiphilus sp.]|jgi:PIN domain nuclease of toxin-antitoxin system|nr:type II toxin-antitoxin system VapC family toxin [Terracidiphilus sp.]
MRYLLDTHIYFWYRSSPQRLSPALLDVLTDRSQEILISVATPWELAIKTGSGKLDAAQLLVDFEMRETAAGFIIAEVRTAQAVRSGLLPPHHRDPFDRLLVAQALDLRIPIISSDPVLDLYGVKRIWD